MNLLSINPAVTITTPDASGHLAHQASSAAVDEFSRTNHPAVRFGRLGFEEVSPEMLDQFGQSIKTALKALGDNFSPADSRRIDTVIAQLIAWLDPDKNPQYEAIRGRLLPPIQRTEGSDRVEKVLLDYFPQKVVSPHRIENVLSPDLIKNALHVVCEAGWLQPITGNGFLIEKRGSRTRNEAITSPEVSRQQMVDTEVLRVIKYRHPTLDHISLDEMAKMVNQRPPFKDSQQLAKTKPSEISTTYKILVQGILDNQGNALPPLIQVNPHYNAEAARANLPDDSVGKYQLTDISAANLNRWPDHSLNRPGWETGSSQYFTRPYSVSEYDAQRLKNYLNRQPSLQRPNGWLVLSPREFARICHVVENDHIGLPPSGKRKEGSARLRGAIVELQKTQNDYLFSTDGPNKMCVVWRGAILRPKYMSLSVRQTLPALLTAIFQRSSGVGHGNLSSLENKYGFSPNLIAQYFPERSATDDGITFSTSDLLKKISQIYGYGVTVTNNSYSALVDTLRDHLKDQIHIEHRDGFTTLTKI